ncbi:hypothetical protein CHS0354_040958 [Potamilus streckersoni]|uniref:Medium-chain acyl-CoA ligase ACSF2, mitochondrial n=1 Tax=Potamilus streckersoni TaxID=2493646 RepID=A0AAE0W7V7_9BIVA|nr:hypothetical protein CHS0354_040958 [Potamilus streckersoni]
MQRTPYARLHTMKENLGVLGPVADDVSGLLQNIRPIYNYDDDICLIMAPSTVNTDNQSAKEFMEFVEKERITWYLGMPFELINTVNSPDFDKYDLSTLRGAILVGHLISSALKTRMREVFPDLQTAYGSTEAVGGAATSAVWSTKEQQISSAGFSFPHAEVKIVDSNGVIVPIGSEGEIFLKGWHTFWGYWRDPEMTRQVKDPDGWVKIGDIGKMDETGHITYVGRAAECVKFKHMGVGVYPSHILNAAKAHPEVAEAKVIGVPTDNIGDMICLCVQLTPSSTLTEDQLKDYMDDQLLDVYRTDNCFIFQELPRTGFRNKVSMTKLRELVIQRLDREAENKQ